MSKTATGINLSLAQMRRRFRSNRGAAAALARDLQVHPTAITHALRGHLASERIVSALRQRAAELPDPKAAVSR